MDIILYTYSFRSLHYYIPTLIILTEKLNVVVVNVFTSTTVVFNHFAAGSQIQTYNFVREPH